MSNSLKCLRRSPFGGLPPECATSFKRYTGCSSSLDSLNRPEAQETQFTLAPIPKKTRLIYILNLALKPATSVCLSLGCEGDVLASSGLISNSRTLPAFKHGLTFSTTPKLVFMVLPLMCFCSLHGLLRRVRDLIFRAITTRL